MASPEYKLSTVVSSAVTAIDENADISNLLSGKPCSVEFKFEDKKPKTYQICLKAGGDEIETMQSKPSVWHRNIDKQTSNGKIKSNSGSCVLLTALYHSRKITPQDYVTLITLPNFLNQRAREALTTLQTDRVKAIVKAIIDNELDAEKLKVLYEALCICDLSKVSAELSALSDEELLELTCSVGASINKSERSLFFYLPKERQAKLLSIVNKESRLKILGFNQDGKFEGRLQEDLNTAINHLVTHPSDLIKNCIEHLDNSQLYFWLISTSPMEVANAITSFPIDKQKACIQIVTRKSMVCNKLSDDDDFIIIDDNEEKYTAILTVICQCAITPYHKKTFQQIFVALQQEDLLKFIQAANKETLKLLLPFIIKSVSSGMRKRVFESLISLPSAVVNNANMSIETLSEVLKLCPKDLRFKFIKVLSDKTKSELLIAIPNALFSQVLDCFTFEQQMEFLSRNEAVEVQRKITQQFISNDLAHNFIKKSYQNCSPAELQVLLQKLPPALNHEFIKALKNIDYIDLVTIIPDSQFQNCKELNLWLNALPFEYIVERASRSTTQCQLARFIPAFTQCLSYEKRMELNHSLNAKQWQSTIASLDDDERILWVDFTNEFQVNFWLNCAGKPSVFIAFGSLPFNKRHQLIDFIPIESLAQTCIRHHLTMSSKNVVMFLTSIVNHSKASDLFIELNEFDPHHCSEILKKIVDGNEIKLERLQTSIGTKNKNNINRLLLQLKVSDNQNRSENKKIRSYQDAGILILRNYKKHQHNLRGGNFKHKTVKVNQDGSQTIYHHSEEKLHPPLRLPTESKLLPHKLQKGTYKKVVKIDGKYVLLEANNKASSSKSDSSKQIFKFNTDTPALRDLVEILDRKRVITGQTAVSLGALGFCQQGNELIAADAGVSLDVWLKPNHKTRSIPHISQLFQLCETLDTARHAGFFFRDIKLENTLYKEFEVKADGTRFRLPKPKLTLIDFTDLCRVQTNSSGEIIKVLGQPTKWCGTYIYTTLELMEKRITGDPFWLATADFYSSIILMLRSLDTKVFNSALCPRYFKSDSQYRGDDNEKKHIHLKDNDETLIFEINKIFEKGILDKRNMPAAEIASIKEAIMTFIVPEHQENILNFMEDPVKNFLSLNLSLTQIFSFTDE